MTYTVPLILPSLRKNETIVQIADTLNHLSRSIDDIMFHIENKIDNSSKKLKEVTDRMDKVDEKISKLRSVKNAVQVFSSSKYPAYDHNSNYTSAFPVETEISVVRHKVSDKFSSRKDETLEKLHIYHVQLSEVESSRNEGIGDIPRDVKNINDLLLYDTGRNLYQELKSTDSVKTQQSIIVKTTDSKMEIGIAPASIQDRSYSNLPSEQYFYSPDLGEVPTLDVPVDLPDLPGIADNVRYKDEDNFAIAPSVAMSPLTSSNPLPEDLENLEGLPEIIETPKKEIVKIEEKLQEIEASQNKPAQDIQKNEEIPEVKPEIQKVEIVQTENVKQELPQIPDAVSSLMEAIRKAGGKKTLKSVKEENVSKKELSGGDLMADLHAKLAMRRKGISGAQKNNENVVLDSRSALSLMSSLIPPPDENDEKNDEETDQDDDWEP